MSKWVFVFLCVMGWCAATLAMQSPAIQALQKKLYVAIKRYKRAKEKAKNLNVFSKRRMPKICMNTPREQMLRTKITYYNAEMNHLKGKIEAASPESSCSESSSSSSDS